MDATFLHLTDRLVWRVVEVSHAKDVLRDENVEVLKAAMEKKE